MCSGEKLNAESSNRAALKECVSKQRGCAFGRTLYSGVLRLQTSSSQGVTQEKDKGLPPPRNNSKAMPGCHGQSPPSPWGRCLPQRHDPSSCCTSSSLVWHWKQRRRLFCLDRLASSDRSVLSSSRGRFTGESSFSDCESNQNNTFGGQVSAGPGKHR